MRLVAPLKSDLAAWRKASGASGDTEYIFQRSDGTPWTDDDWRNFRKRRFAKAARDAGVSIDRPYDLRHSAASLWLHEGINPIQVAAWLGHSPAMTLTTYAHVIADLDPADRSTAAEVIKASRP